jgi:transcription elongation factor Elf1
MKCKRCSKTTTRKTNTAPKQGKRQWYAWYFHCPACGWLYMPAKAVRTLHTSTGGGPKGGTHKCHQCHAGFSTDRELLAHPCKQSDDKHSRELERGTGHYGLYRPWLGY